MPNDSQRLLDLIERLARLISAEDRGHGLNPAQRAALAYLARANVFSRAPSHVADYLCTTRGTASQTLKSLEQKGLVRRGDTPGDRRSITYTATAEGMALVSAIDPLDPLSDTQRQRAASALDALLREMLARRGYRSFGICRTCRHHQQNDGGRSCALLNVALTADAAEELCHEHVPCG